MPLRLLLAEDHAVVRQGVRVLLESEGFQVSAEACNGHEAVRLAAEIHPDIAILDISMPLLNGLDAARELRKNTQGMKVILLTRHDEPQYVTEALRAGVKGYVLKNQAATDLVAAIQQVGRGGVYLSPNISSALMEACLSKSEPDADPLTVSPNRNRQFTRLKTLLSVRRSTCSVRRKDQVLGKPGARSAQPFPIRRRLRIAAVGEWCVARPPSPPRAGAWTASDCDGRSRPPRGVGRHRQCRSGGVRSWQPLHERDRQPAGRGNARGARSLPGNAGAGRQSVHTAG